MKTARYRPVGLVNAPHYHRSVHEAIVHRETGANGPGPRILKPAIAPEHFDKIRLGFNWTFLPEIVLPGTRPTVPPPGGRPGRPDGHLHQEIEPRVGGSRSIRLICRHFDFPFLCQPHEYGR